MKNLISATAFLILMGTGALPAFGAAGDLGAPVVVTPLQPNVTYSESSPVLNTYAGFTVTGFQSIGTNTINDLSVKFEAWVTDPAETLSLHLPNVYLAGLPNTCDWTKGAANKVTITCQFKQFRAGDRFPEFTVFYKAPTKVCNGVADSTFCSPGFPETDEEDHISTMYTIVYAEGRNDCQNGCANSVIERLFKDQVLLGTVNPIDVKSGVPQTKDSEAVRLFTGNGVPKNEPNKKFTEELHIPPLADLGLAYAKAELLISSVKSTDDALCGNFGNFEECPGYTTEVVKPAANETDPPVPVQFTADNPLKTVYRFEGAIVKRPASQFFNNLQVRYVPDGWIYDPDNASTYKVLKMCVGNTGDYLNGGVVVPCVSLDPEETKCFKANENTPDLPRDCQVTTRGLKNGRTLFY